MYVTSIVIKFKQLVPLHIKSFHQGHINMMLQLGCILHSRGFSITIAHTQFNFPNTSNHPDFNFLPVADGFSDRS
jgi:hypothetical protein